MTSFLDSTHVNLPKTITGISVIDCDRYNLLVFNFQPRNSFAKQARLYEILVYTDTLTFTVVHRKKNILKILRFKSVINC